MPAMVEEKTDAKKDEKKPKRAIKRKSVDKWKKKKWFTVFSPDFFNQQELGETVAEEAEQLVGRTLNVNAGSLTKQAKLRHIDLVFSVSKFQGQKAFTAFKEFSTQDSYVLRLVRRRNSKIEIVEDVSVQTGEKVRVKVVTITNRKASVPQKTLIRKLMRDELFKSAASKPFDQFVQELLFGNLSSAVFKAVKKVVSIKRVEVLKARVLHQKGKGA